MRATAPCGGLYFIEAKDVEGLVIRELMWVEGDATGGSSTTSKTASQPTKIHYQYLLKMRPTLLGD